MNINNALVVDIGGLDGETVQKIRDAVAAVLVAADGSVAAATPTGGPPVPAPSVRGWTVAVAARLVEDLVAANRPVQAATLVAEADNRGYASRATVYAIGAYPPTRSLNGFTKPVRRMMRELIADGLIPPDAANPMKPEYDPAQPTFQQVQGFSMPAEVATIFAAATVAIDSRVRSAADRGAGIDHVIRG